MRMLITASLTNGVCDVPCPSQAWAAPQQCGRTESLSDLDTAYPDDAGHLIAEPLVPHSWCTPCELQCTVAVIRCWSWYSCCHHIKMCYAAVFHGRDTAVGAQLHVLISRREPPQAIGKLQADSTGDTSPRGAATILHNSVETLSSTTPVTRPSEPPFSRHVRCVIHSAHALLASTSPLTYQAIQCQQRSPG